MNIDIKVPNSGESITSASVSSWHQQDGGFVRKGEIIVTLDTDKVSTDIEASTDGSLHILVQEGEEVPIGTVIGHIDDSAAAPVKKTEAAEDLPPPPPPAPAPVAKPAPAPAAAPASGLTTITVPPAGESITSATIATWNKRDGDTVAEGEIIVVLDTDKVSHELEAPTSGTLRILAPEGSEVAIGATIAEILPASEAIPAPAPAPAPVQKPEPAAAATPQPAAPAPPAKPDFAAALQATREAPAATSQASSDGRTTRRKMTTLRRKIATHLVNAQQTAAILSTFNEVDMTEVMNIRKTAQEAFVAKHGIKLGFMSFFVKAVVNALKEIPSINAQIDGDDIIENHFYDIGVAIGTEKGLVVPVIRNADQKSLAEIEKDILNYAEKARTGKITFEDLQGGVFTISNGGTYGSLLSTPILNPPQSGILGMHTIQKRPVALGDQVVIRPMMYLALSYDHRLVDGKEAVTFLIRIKDALESPLNLLL